MDMNRLMEVKYSNIVDLNMIDMIVVEDPSQSAFYVNLYRAVIGPSG